MSEDNLDYKVSHIRIPNDDNADIGLITGYYKSIGKDEKSAQKLILKWIQEGLTKEAKSIGDKIPLNINKKNKKKK